MKLKLTHDQKLAAKINSLANKDKAIMLSRFFKTAPGQYGAHDLFLGITVPQIRVIVKKYQAASDLLVLELLASVYHEVRLLGILIIVSRYEQAKDEREQKKHLDFYLKHRYALNNWDLVDLSVYKVWGNYLVQHPADRKMLFVYAASENLWERRMAIVACMALIKAGQSLEILQLVNLLKGDQEDLIQKALGWMLREVGKKEEKTLKKYLDQEASSLARTTLRYSIERLVEADRQAYLKQKNEKKVGIN